ncbi:MAG: starvation-inducible DNA-binding protein [Rickettsiales bacterium]
MAINLYNSTIKIKLIMNNQNTARSLQTVLANSYALYLKTQNYHWNVTGPNFKGMHELFGLQYEELAVAIDLLAERIRALDVLVPASFDAFGNGAQIVAGNEKAIMGVMTKELYDDNKTLVKIIGDALKIAAEEGDEATADMLIARLEVHDKAAWMLKSSL